MQTCLTVCIVEGKKTACYRYAASHAARPAARESDGRRVGDGSAEDGGVASAWLQATTRFHAPGRAACCLADRCEHRR